MFRILSWQVISLERKGAVSLRSKMISGLAALALAFGGLTLSAPDAEASCKIANLGWWSVKNVSCSQARHYNLIKGGVYKYAPWAGKGKVSSQGVCWANAVRYGAIVRP